MNYIVDTLLPLKVAYQPHVRSLVEQLNKALWHFNEREYRELNLLGKFAVVSYKEFPLLAGEKPSLLVYIEASAKDPSDGPLLKRVNDNVLQGRFVLIDIDGPKYLASFRKPIQYAPEASRVPENVSSWNEQLQSGYYGTIDEDEEGQPSFVVEQNIINFLLTGSRFSQPKG